jgi:DNA-binding IclR family transcriptional regulator
VSTAAVKSAKRTVDILALMTSRETRMTFTEISVALDLPRSSLHGLLTTLVESGWVTYDSGSRTYGLGIRTLEAGNAYLRTDDLPSRARPFMERIRDALDETIQLSVLDGRFNVYVAKFDGQQALVLASAVGRRLPAHATGVGKVLLADLDHATVEHLLSNVKLERYTKNTLTDKAALYRRLQIIRDVGYGTDNEEYTIGVRCVAVPVRDQRGQVIAAMSVSVPVIRFDEESSTRALALLMKGASELSAALGYREIPNGDNQLDRSQWSKSAAGPTRASPGLCEPGAFGGGDMGFGEHQVDAGQVRCPPGEIGPAPPPGALEGPAGLVTSRRDARHQGQRRGHRRQRQAAGSDQHPRARHRERRSEERDGRIGTRPGRRRALIAGLAERRRDPPRQPGRCGRYLAAQVPSRACTRCRNRRIR